MSARYKEEDKQYGARERNTQSTRGIRRPADDDIRNTRESPRRAPGASMMDVDRSSQHVSDAMDPRDQTRLQQPPPQQPNTAIPRAGIEPRQMVRPNPMSPRDEEDDDDMFNNGRPSPFNGPPGAIPAQRMPGEIQQVPQMPQTMGPRRPDRDEYDDPPRGNDRNDPSQPELLGAAGRPHYNDYFLPGDGIDREVIQSEICRFLGNDATCKPGTNREQTRRGYIIRAYRPPTTEMIRSLKEESAKYMRVRQSAADRRGPAMTYGDYRRVEYRGVEEHDVMMIDPPQADRYDLRFNTGRQYEEPRRQVPLQQVPVTYAQQDRDSSYMPFVTTAGPPPGYRPQQYNDFPDYQPYPIDQVPPRQPQPQPIGYRPEEVYIQQVRPGQNVMPAAPFPGPRGAEPPRQTYQSYPQEPPRRR